MQKQHNKGRNGQLGDAVDDLCCELHPDAHHKKKTGEKEERVVPKSFE